MKRSPPTDFCPYVGLEPYTETHRDYFYGRHTDVDRIVSNLVGAPLTILYGPSGVGKSSILQASVVPRLRKRARTSVVLFNDWQGPDFLARLKARCAAEVPVARHRAPPAPGAEVSLDALLGELATRSARSVLLIFDQFEQYLLDQAAGGDGRPFEVELARTINRRDVDANVVIALRDDCLSRLDRFRRRIPDVLRNLLPLRHLTAAAAVEAIREPLRVYRRRYPGERAPVTVEDALVRRLLADVRAGEVGVGGPGWHRAGDKLEDDDPIETSFLQLVLVRLWHEERRLHSRALRLATLLGQRVGGARAVLQKHVDDRLRRLSAEDAEVAARIFRFMVTPTGMRIAHGIEDLVAFGSRGGEELPVDRTPEQVRAVLEALRGARILRPLSQPDRFEIFHDVLARAVLDWRSRHEELKFAREAHGAWVAMRSWAVLRERFTGTPHVLTGPAITVGRSEPPYWENDVNLQPVSHDRLVSRTHVILFRHVTEAVAYDMRSLNGTTVNGDTVEYMAPVIVHDGDTITLAGVPLTFEPLVYPEPTDPRLRPEPAIAAGARMDGWGLLIGGGNPDVRPLRADRYVLVLDESRKRLIVEGKASGAWLRLERQPDGRVILRNPGDVELLRIARTQYDLREIVSREYQHLIQDPVLVGRGYTTERIEEERIVDVSAAWRYGGVPFQIVWPPVPAERD